MKAINHKNRDIVQTILERFPETRDSDHMLVARFWQYEKKTKNIRANLIHAYYHGELTSGDSITRLARKIKETHPELQGTTRERRKELEREMRNRARNGEI